MSKTYVRAISLFLSMSLLGIGCTDQLADFSESSEIDIPPPTFQGKTEAQVTVTSPLVTIPVNGECDVRTKALSTMIEGLEDWTTVESLAADTPSVNCQEKTFSFHLPHLKSMKKIDIAQKATIRLKVKALTVAGYSKASTLTINYDPGKNGTGNLPGFVISPAGGLTSSANFQLKNRISFSGASEVQGSHFKLQSGFKATSR